MSGIWGVYYFSINPTHPNPPLFFKIKNNGKGLSSQAYEYFVKKGMKRCFLMI